KAEEYIATHTPDQASEGEQAKQQSAPKQPGQKAETPNAYVAFAPTEMIETKGEPQYKPIPETRLEYAENTNANLFRLEGVYYLMISGVLAKGGSLRGPWSFLDGSDMLLDFAMILMNNFNGTGFDPFLATTLS